MSEPPRAATPMAFVRAMVLAYDKYGKDPASALRQAGISRRQLQRVDACITSAQMETFSGSAMQELDDEALGWFSQPLPWGSYGMLCRASVTSPDLGVALKRWCRHHRLLTRDVLLTLTIAEPYADLEVVEQVALDPRMRELCLLSLLRYVHGFACWAVDSRISVVESRYPHPAPRHAAAYRLFFPGPVRFDARRAGLRFATRYLALPLRRDEAAMRGMLRRALPLTVRQYRRDRLLVPRVRELILENPTAASLADALNLSVRTLHRQLRAEHTTLQALKDRVRCDRASELLLRTPRQIKQVARAVGFDSEKSFARAFKEWTGETPAEFRHKRSQDV